VVLLCCALPDGDHCGGMGNLFTRVLDLLSGKQEKRILMLGELVRTTDIHGLPV